jgi:hypothetical protein
MARFFDTSGAAAGAEFPVADYGPSDPNYVQMGYAPHPAFADDGSFVVAWSEMWGYPQYTCCVYYSAVGRRSGLRAIGLWIPTGNGVLEPGENVVVGTAWANDTADAVALTGTATAFSGPAGATYTLDDSTADYGTLAASTSITCSATANCYQVNLSAPAVRPVAHWDAQLQEALSVGVPKTWALHVGGSFSDVPVESPFYTVVETLLHAGVTGGCASGGYCPGDSVTRAQMAVFLLKSKLGAAHVPPPCTGTVFADVPCAGSPFDPWIEELSAFGITGGCGGNLYCPGDAVTREQMAAFLLKTREGSTYVPPACTGIFADVPCTPGAGFSDWIEELHERGITGGCSAAPALYCPTTPNTRAQMAAFLTRTFGLALYGGGR